MKNVKTALKMVLAAGAIMAAAAFVPGEVKVEISEPAATACPIGVVNC